MEAELLVTNEIRITSGVVLLWPNVKDYPPPFQECEIANLSSALALKWVYLRWFEVIHIIATQTFSGFDASLIITE